MCVCVIVRSFTVLSCDGQLPRKLVRRWFKGGGVVCIQGKTARAIEKEGKKMKKKRGREKPVMYYIPESL